MFPLLAVFAVLLLTVDAVPHRGDSPTKSRDAQLSRTAWNEIWRATESASGNIPRGKVVAVKSSTERLKAKQSSIPDRSTGVQAPIPTILSKTGHGSPVMSVRQQVPRFTELFNTEPRSSGQLFGRHGQRLADTSNTLQMIPERSIAMHLPTIKETRDDKRLISGRRVQTPIFTETSSMGQLAQKRPLPTPFTEMTKSRQVFLKRPMPTPFTDKLNDRRVIQKSPLPTPVTELTNARRVMPTSLINNANNRHLISKQHISTKFTEHSKSGPMAVGTSDTRFPLTGVSNSKPLVVMSSTERLSKGQPRVNQLFTTRPLRPKTVTKKLAGRPTTVRKYRPKLLTDTISMSKQPKCHMPWINELSKIQFYYDGINALCDLAMTFEPCATSGTVCRRHPVEFTCCPSTSIPVLKRCYKDIAPPENVCLPTTIQMAGMPAKPIRRRRPLINVPRSRVEGRTLLKEAPRGIMIPGCSLDCSPAWVNMFSNIKPVQNETLPVCEFRDVFQSCSAPDGLCTSHPVGSTCCPLKCIPDLEKCYVENPPSYVCTPKTLQPWIRRIRKYFTG